MRTSRKAYIVVTTYGRWISEHSFVGGHFKAIEGVFTNEHAAKMCARQWDRNDGIHATVQVQYMNDGRVDLSGV